MIGLVLVVVAIVLALFVAFGAHVFTLALLDLLTLAVVIGFVGVIVGVLNPWRRG